MRKHNAYIPSPFLSRVFRLSFPWATAYSISIDIELVAVLLYFEDLDPAVSLASDVATRLRDFGCRLSRSEGRQRRLWLQAASTDVPGYWTWILA